MVYKLRYVLCEHGHSRGCRIFKFYFLSTDKQMVEIHVHLSNQALLVRKLIFFLIFRKHMLRVLIVPHRDASNEYSHHMCLFVCCFLLLLLLFFTRNKNNIYELVSHNLDTLPSLNYEVMSSWKWGNGTSLTSRAWYFHSPGHSFYSEYSS